MIPKYRAWDSWRKRMSVVDRIYIDTEGVRLYDDFGEYWRNFRDIKLMQSTGVNDRNSVEIFEGDILEIQGIRMVVKFGSYEYIESSKSNGHTLGVVYDGLGFYAECINVADPDNISPFEPETLKNSQIIGNIYENPEFLEVKE
nr:MAG TPA_asm: YopX protein [Caudoviricetes sp.]